MLSNKSIYRIFLTNLYGRYDASQGNIGAEHTGKINVTKLILSGKPNIVNLDAHIRYK
jgi:hypothetical protein